MRFDTSSPLTAADIINSYSLEDLICIFQNYGEERHARKIAQEIIRERRKVRFTRTTQLADFIAGIIWPRRGQIHPATRVFQALRIAANREIEVLSEALPAALSILSAKGRLVVISYHSLEDRIVKNFFRTEKQKGTLNILTKKPVTPEPEAIEAHRRARSAKLRAAEKI